MNAHEILQVYEQQLADEVAASGTPLTLKPFETTPWIAMSLLQKAARRGHLELALRAAATLLRDDPARLWRRCGVIAFEDIGMGNLETVGLTLAALAGKTFRKRIGGDVAVASYVVSRMVAARKSRVTDDMLVSAERHPDLQVIRTELASEPLRGLLRIVACNGALTERTIALWYAVGTKRYPSDHLLPREGDPQAAFEFLFDQGVPNSLVELCREGFRKTGQILCPLLSLAFLDRDRVSVTEINDSLPPVAMCGGLPGYALDMFTREGRGALRRFLLLDCGTTAWAREHVPTAHRLSFLGDALFYVEGSLMANRMDGRLDRVKLPRFGGVFAGLEDYGSGLTVPMAAS